MSTRITAPVPLDPVAAGDACVNCWGQGKPFGSGGTPETIEITFEGVEKNVDWVPGAGEPIDGTFTLVQDVVFSCWYRFGGFPTTEILVEFRAGETFVGGTSDTNVTCFRGTSVQACSTVVGNEWAFRFKNGTATIRIPGII